MLTDRERNQAIKEGHRNAAEKAYFNERPHLADDNGIRCFDAGFDRGWDAACAERDARIAEMERELEEARKDAERYEFIASTCEVTFMGRAIESTEDLDAAIKEQT